MNENVKLVQPVQPTIIDAGLSDFTKPMGEGLSNLAQPYNCIPLYFNDDQAQAELIHRAKVSDLGAVVYISNQKLGPDQAQFGWLIFRQSISTLTKQSVAYQEWEDFIFNSDYVLPVNLQVNSHQDQAFLDGTGNINEGALINVADQSFGKRFAVVSSGSESIKCMSVDGSMTGFDHSAHPDPKQLGYRNGVLHFNEYPDHMLFNKLTAFTVNCRNARLTTYAPADHYVYHFLNMLEQMYYFQLFDDSHYDQYINDLNQYLSDDHDDVINETFNSPVYTAPQNYVTYFGWLASCLLHPFSTSCRNLNWLRLTYLMIIPAYWLLGYGWVKMNLWSLSMISIIMVVLMVVNYVLILFGGLPNMSETKVKTLRDLGRNQNISINLQAIVLLAGLELGVNIISAVFLTFLFWIVFLIILWYLIGYGVLYYYQQNSRSKSMVVSILVSYYGVTLFFSYWILEFVTVILVGSLRLHI